MAGNEKFHRDWRDWIAKKLRRKIKRDTGREPARPYLMRSLDKFARLVPHLKVGKEVIMELQDLCDLVNKPGDNEIWTPNSASRFMTYMRDIGIVEKRYAGRSGNAFTLTRTLAIPPDPSRQSGSGQIRRAQPAPQGDKKDEPTIPTEVEVDPMPASPAACYAAQPGPDEIVELDGSAVLAAIDQISDRLSNIKLLASKLNGEAAAAAYDAEVVVSQAVQDLQRLRSAVQRGDGAPLQEILDRE